MTTKNFTEIGRTAYLNGDARAPMFNTDVAQAIAELPIGGGAAAIMRAFTKGWDAENLATEVR